jgi:hypothetical protein
MTSWQIFYPFSDSPGDSKKSASMATTALHGPTFILEMSRVDDFFQQPGSNYSHMASMAPGDRYPLKQKVTTGRDSNLNNGE